MKKILLLGASGSIGMQTIDVCLAHKDLYEIVGMSVGRNIEQLRSILKQVKCRFICVQLESDAIKLCEEYPEITFFHSDSGLIELINKCTFDVLVNALVGFVGLKPTLEAIKLNKDIALANKETLVVAGEIVTEEAKKHNVSIIPIDSEHSAIFQCLQGYNIDEVNRVIITASGGSFRNLERDELKNVTVEQALAHPNWSMGAKITIDSATMMNKGFEVIEAHYLFNLPYDKINVIMHPESVIHSMVEYVDTSVIAQLGTPDMRLPIQFALSEPNRIELHNASYLDFTKTKNLTFKEVDYIRFPLLKLAYDVGRKKGNLPTIMNAANEVANRAFLDKRISFLDIETLILNACSNIQHQKYVTLDDILLYDKLTREYVEKIILEGEI